MAKYDEATYISCIREACPKLVVESARLHNFSDGQFNAILFVDEAQSSEPIVFRFPRVESAAHTDFGGSNILFDEARCTVTGVIDWAGIKLCDPAIDVGAIMHMGESFVARMLKTYPEMEQMAPRASSEAPMCCKRHSTPCVTMICP